MRWVFLILLCFFAVCLSACSDDAVQDIIGKQALCSCSGDLDYAYIDPEYMTDIAYSGIDDYFDNVTSYPGSGMPARLPVTVSVRESGRLISTGYACSASIERSVYLAARDAAAGLREAFQHKERHYDVEVSVHYDFREGIPERGVDGIIDTDSCSFIEGKEIVEKNYNLKSSFSKVCNNCTPHIFSSQVYGTAYTQDGSFRFFRGNPVELHPDPKTARSIPDFTKQDLDLLYKDARAWLLHQFEDGSFRYKYQPSSDIFPPENNMIRQLMSSVILAGYAEDNSSYLDIHKENIDFILDNWVKKDKELMYVFYDNKSKLGANAMLLRVFANSPLLHEYRHEADSVAEAVLSQMHPDGSFSAWFIEPGYEYDEDYLLTFYSGEAILALVEYCMATNNTRYLDAAILAQKHYIRKYIDGMEENYYPAYVPWHTQSLYKLYLVTGNKTYLDNMIIMNDRLLELQNTDGKPYLDYLGRFYDPKTPQYGSPHASSDAIYTESLAYAYQAAMLLNYTEKADTYRQSIILSLSNLKRLEFSGANMYYITIPGLVEGGIRTSIYNNHLRIDNNQHTLDAIDAISSFSILDQ